MPKIPKIKTPTERQPTKISELLGSYLTEFKETYLPFVEWAHCNATVINGRSGWEYDNCIVEFVEDIPIKYENKWSREQYKISVIQDGQDKVLSGGQRLFACLRKLIEETNNTPSEMGRVQIKRFGSGFDTTYKMELDNENLDSSVKID